MMGNRQTPKKLKIRQSENFGLTYFSRPHRKKLWHFEDNTVSRGKTVPKIPQKRHHLSLGFDMRFFVTPDNDTCLKK